MEQAWQLILMIASVVAATAYVLNAFHKQKKELEGKIQDLEKKVEAHQDVYDVLKRTMLEGLKEKFDPATKNKKLKNS
ncbi:MAG: hypothetical protein IPK70_15110 [Flavobacteriales bacterium]|jgi:predicted  nucleic acid-binding Zn-ribbon protein|nr:hypothetical protein [Flavobacteriales bacterium]